MLVLANMDFQVPSIDFIHIIPLVVLGLLMVLALCLELRDEEPQEQSESSKPAIVGLGSIGLVGLIVYYLKVGDQLLWSGPKLALTFNDMIYNDVLSRTSGLLIVVCALLALLTGLDELERFQNYRGGEFCALIFSASLGMVLMVSAANTMVLFLGLELFSLALYLLCIFLPDRTESRESGMKYFLLSSAASAILLYGLALLYGATGSTWITEMAINPQMGGLAVLGTLFVVCGLLFKLAVVPFHFWAPDVYEGAPTTVTAFMSVATKVAALTALWRILNVLDSGSLRLSVILLFTLAVLSILVGNFLALAQTSVKRMLAFSGVANAGYLLIAPVVGEVMLEPMLFFLAAYLVGNMGAFLALAQIEAHLGQSVERSDLLGLFQRKPWLAASFALCLVSLAGLPPAGGFMAKFFLFGTAIGEGQLLLPVIGIAGSLVGAGYYLGTAVCLFGKPAEGADTAPAQEQEGTSSSQVALGLCCAGILFLGILPTEFLNWVTSNL